MKKEQQKTLILAGIIWIILIIPFLIMGSMISFVSFYYLILPATIIYALLWIIPIKFPKIKPLIISLIIGIVTSLFIIPITIFIYWLLFIKNIGPNELAGVGVPYILVPLLVIINLTALIIGIILTIKKNKT